jgi:hypothetical protein
MMVSEERVESVAGVDRRSTRRHAYRQLVWFKIMGEAADLAGDCLEGVSRSSDISTSGLGLVSSVPMPVGKSVFVEIPGRGFKFSAMGRVVYSCPLDGKFHRVGIRFSVIPPNSRVDLDRLIEGRDQAADPSCASTPSTRT